MKRFIMHIEMTVTDEFYEEEVADMRKDILSGKMQREIKKSGRGGGIKKVTATTHTYHMKK